MKSILQRVEKSRWRSAQIACKMARAVHEFADAIPHLFNGYEKRKNCVKAQCNETFGVPARAPIRAWAFLRRSAFAAERLPNQAAREESL